MSDLPQPPENPYPAPTSEQVSPLDAVTTTQPEVPLHPLLPGGAGGTEEDGESLDDAYAAHQAPHAASAGPNEGARGALWFAIVLAVIVLASLIAAVAVLAGTL